LLAFPRDLDTPSRLDRKRGAQREREREGDWKKELF
jgi:hypothetical protein